MARSRATHPSKHACAGPRRNAGPGGAGGRRGADDILVRVCLGDVAAPGRRGPVGGRNARASPAACSTRRYPAGDGGADHRHHGPCSAVRRNAGAGARERAPGTRSGTPKIVRLPSLHGRVSPRRHSCLPLRAQPLFPGGTNLNFLYCPRHGYVIRRCVTWALSVGVT